MEQSELFPNTALVTVAVIGTRHTACVRLDKDQMMELFTAVSKMMTALEIAEEQ